MSALLWKSRVYLFFHFFFILVFVNLSLIFSFYFHWFLLGFGIFIFFLHWFIKHTPLLLLLVFSKQFAVIYWAIHSCNYILSSNSGLRNIYSYEYVLMNIYPRSPKFQIETIIWNNHLLKAKPLSCITQKNQNALLFKIIYDIALGF